MGLLGIGIVVVTLAACITIGDTPALIADLMVSRTGIETEHKAIPTHRDLSVVLPTEWMRIVSGVTRKTMRIGRRFVVAGAGDLVAIRQVFRGIKSSPLKTRESVHRLERMLKGIDLGRFECGVVGWSYPVGPEKPWSFSWVSGGELEAGGSYLIGSGAEKFRSDILRSIQSVEGDKSRTTPAVLKALEASGHMVGEQNFTGFGLPELFGGGFEIMLLGPSGFFQVDNFVFLNWVLEGVKMRMPPDLMLHQYYAGDVMVLRAIWSATGEEKIHIAKPLAGTVRITKRKLKHPPQPPYFGNFCIAPTDKGMYGVVTSSLYDPDHDTLKIHRSQRGIALDFHAERFAKLLHPAAAMLVEKLAADKGN